jgi:acetyltransferase-like isoleucine patch superfamily enzyme
MSLVLKGIKAIGFCFATAVSKIRWKGLNVSGLFRKRCDTQIIISENGKMSIGRDVRFQRNVSLTSVGGVLSIGNNVSFNRNNIIICRKEITIGDNVIFGPGVTIYDHDHVFSEEGILPGYKHGAVVIEKGCWIASNVTILRNTHIGEGCVIGAGAVVKGVIPQHSLVTSDRGLNIVSIKNRTM